MTRLLSDEPALPGLLWAMAFDAAGSGRVLAHGEPLPALDAPEGFLWLHVNLNDARVADLAARGALGPARLAAAAFAGDPHQRLAVDEGGGTSRDGHIGGVVADLLRRPDPVEPDPAAPDASGRLHFVLGPRFLVTGRRHPIRGPQAVREALEAGRPVAAPVLVLERIVGETCAAMAEEGTRLDEALDAIEDHILDERVRADRRRLGPIRREAVRLHRQLHGLRAVFRRLAAAGADEGLPAGTPAASARLAQRLDGLDRDMVALAERSRLMQEELSAGLARQLNRQLHTLSVLTALFLPPSLITSLYGVNARFLPVAEGGAGSSIAIVLAVLSALAGYAAIRFLGVRSFRE